MNKRLFPVLNLLALAMLVATPVLPAAAQDSGLAAVEFSEVRAVFRKRCMTCHNIDEARGDLDLSSMTTIESGSGSGPVIVPGKPTESLLYTVSAHLEEPVMPPNSPKIPGRELDLIKRWIEGMAVASDSASEGTDDESPAATMSGSSMGDSGANSALPTEDAADQQGFVAIRPVLRHTTVSSLAVHPTKPLFVTAGRNQAVMGNLETGQWVSAINFPHGEVTALRFSEDGETLLIAGGVAGLSGTVIGVDVGTGLQKFQVADEVDTILAVDMSENGRLVAVGGPTKVVRIYSIDSGEVLHTLKKHTDWIMSLAFSPDGLLLASGDRFGGVFVWNPEDGEVFHTLQGHQGTVSAIAWDNGSETLLTGCDDAKLRVWNMHHGEMTTAWDAQVGSILSVAHATNNATLVGGRQNKATLWYGPEIQKMTSSAEDQVVQVGLSAAGKWAVLGDALGNINILSSESGELTHTMKLPVNDGEVNQLLARLQSMEAEYIATVELDLKAAKAAESIQTESDSMRPIIAEAMEGPSLGSEQAESVLTNIEAIHGSLVASLKAQQQLASNLTTLRQQAEKAVAELTAAEQEGQKLLQQQMQLVESSKKKLEGLRSSLRPKLNREQLLDRLQAETVLVDRAEQLLDAISSQTHLVGSEESQLLETLKQSLLERTEATRQAIEEVDQ